MTATALIIGISGNIGTATAAAFLAHGWRVRALARDVASARRDLPFGERVDWRQGDALDRDDMVQAAAGADVILHAANPPGYRRWRELALPMLDNAIAAAGASGARLLFPGNIYPYGPDAWPVLPEDAPQHPVSRKGRIRVEMEQRLRAAAGRGVRSLILRAGDYFGSARDSSWLGAVMVKPGRRVTAVTYPGDPGVGHAWAYLPDVAETFVRLAARDAALEPFERIHFAGHHLDPGGAMVEAIRRAVGKAVPMRRLPWWLLKPVMPFNETLREAAEMRYLWFNDIALDNTRLVELLGDEPRTPLDTAVAETLGRMGCLDPRTEDAAAKSG
ncbi:NAD(P)H-binding protein [Ectothiorhodospiraceae bacterium WFHF3C12]|nr:NAD(P)H-binding protein [Ectothiorhodospiraceae bacterium WFHF3C12]